VGVIRETQASIGLAVHYTLPTVPPQMCQYHDVKDGAQPVCDADRHVKTARKKQVRGVSDLERPAEQSPSQEAQVVADYGLAMRTVMRDEGKYPREPPGLQLDQNLPLIAASVERVMAAHPSALLKRRSRLLSV